MASKNLGQVSGLHVGSTPPSNILLIWYDNTPNQKCHRVYDEFKGEWVPIDQKIVSNITYGELVGIAGRLGLAIGKWYKIVDRGNVMALAITPTKVQYTDLKGNILIDDLGNNVQYHVTSSNLLVDDIMGVFDETSKKLVFRFEDNVPNADDTDGDYFFGKGKRNGVWKLLKYRLSRLISSENNNSIQWRNGLFLSFKDSIKNYLDKESDYGIVSYRTYISHAEQYDKLLNNIAKGVQIAPDEFAKLLAKAIANREVFNKTLEDEPVDYQEPIEIRSGDSIYILISKLWSWIKKIRFANGVRISSEFKEAKSQQYVNSNDTVESAIGKIQYWLRNMVTFLSISRGYKPKESSLPSMEAYDVKEGDTLETAISKIEGVIKISGLYAPYSYRYNSPNSNLQMSVDLKSQVTRIASRSTYLNTKYWTEVVLGRALPSSNITNISSNTGLMSVGVLSSYQRQNMGAGSENHMTANALSHVQKYHAKGSIMTDNGMGAFGSSWIYGMLKRGFFDRAELDKNKSTIVTSFIGCFDGEYLDDGINKVISDSDNAIYAGVYGTVNFKSFDKYRGYGFGGGFEDGGELTEDDWSESLLQFSSGNRVFGGVFDRLLVRGLIYSYAFNNEEAKGSNSSADDRTYHISQTDSLFVVNCQFGAISGSAPTTTVILPSDPTVGQSVKIFAITDAITGNNYTVSVKPSRAMKVNDHIRFWSSSSGFKPFIKISPQKIYEFIYTEHVGWVAFECPIKSPTD